MITIEKPSVDDIQGIQNVLYKTWLATYPNEKVGITKEDIKELFKHRLSKESIQKRTADLLSKDNFFLVAKNEALIIGICKVAKYQDKNELGAIYILPSYQGKGIGKKLWLSAIKFFDNSKDIFVRVADYNNQAINFYKKLGFVETRKHFIDKHKMPLSGKFIPEIELVIKRNFS